MISSIWIVIALGFGFVFGEMHGVEHQKKKEKAAVATSVPSRESEEAKTTQHSNFDGH